MIKWLDKKNDSSNSILRILMNVVSKVFQISKYSDNSCVTVKTLCHNQKFLKLMDKLDIVYYIERKGIVLRINRFDFLRKISEEYPMFFSAMIIEEACIKEWDDLSIFDDEENKNYSVDIEIKSFFIEMFCLKDSLVLRYTKEDIENIYGIVSNIRFDVMAKIYYKRSAIPSLDSMDDIYNSPHKMNDYELSEYYGYLSKFNAAKIYIENYINLIFKYKDEYPIVCEDIKCVDFLLEVENEDEIKILLERLTEFYITIFHGDCEASEYFYRIIEENKIESFEAKKKLLMMDSWEYVFIYKKINKLIWMNESLDILYDKNIREEISYALCNDNIEFVLDDILYYLVQSLCKEYKELNPIRACEFFDNLSLKEYDNDCSFTERKDIICNAISNKYQYIEKMFKTDMTSVSIMNTDDIWNINNVNSISFKKFEKLSNDLRIIKFNSNINFDYVSEFIIFSSHSKNIRCTFAFDSISNILFVDIRNKNETYDFEKYLNELINKGVVDRILLWTNEKSKKMTGFKFELCDVSCVDEVYEIYNIEN